jgi:hypothetical protein
VVRKLQVTFALADANQPVQGHQIADHDRSPERINDVSATALAIATVRDMDMDYPPNRSPAPRARASPGRDHSHLLGPNRDRQPGPRRALRTRLPHSGAQLPQMSPREGQGRRGRRSAWGSRAGAPAHSSPAGSCAPTRARGQRVAIRRAELDELRVSRRRADAEPPRGSLQPPQLLPPRSQIGSIRRLSYAAQCFGWRDPRCA